MLENTANLYLQLGIAGATLFILLLFVWLLFKYITKVGQTWENTLKTMQKNENVNQGNKIEKLCDKIDALISSNAEYTQKLNEVLLSNDKDQEANTHMLDKILTSVLDTQRRVVRIDDRTYKCLGNPNKKTEEG